MATTRIIPMHINKGKTIAQCLSDRTEYAMNPDKTEAGEFVSSFACDPLSGIPHYQETRKRNNSLHVSIKIIPDNKSAFKGFR